MKKTYTAPAAELVVLAPAEAVSLNEKPWTPNGFFWKSDSADIPTSVGGSVSTYWYDFGSEELD